MKALAILTAFAFVLTLSDTEVSSAVNGTVSRKPVLASSSPNSRHLGSQRGNDTRGHASTMRPAKPTTTQRARAQDKGHGRLVRAADGPDTDPPKNLDRTELLARLGAFSDFFNVQGALSSDVGVGALNFTLDTGTGNEPSGDFRRSADLPVDNGLSTNRTMAMKKYLLTKTISEANASSETSGATNGSTGSHRFPEEWHDIVTMPGANETEGRAKGQPEMKAELAFAPDHDGNKGRWGSESASSWTKDRPHEGRLVQEGLGEDVCGHEKAIRCLKLRKRNVWPLIHRGDGDSEHTPEMCRALVKFQSDCLPNDRTFANAFERLSAAVANMERDGQQQCQESASRLLIVVTEYKHTLEWHCPDEIYQTRTIPKQDKGNDPEDDDDVIRKKVAYQKLINREYYDDQDMDNNNIYDYQRMAGARFLVSSSTSVFQPRMMSSQLLFFVTSMWIMAN